MHLKGRGFWLYLGALAIVATPWKILSTLKIEPYALDRIAESYWQFTTVLAFLFVPVLILVAVETAARPTAAGMRPILYSKPFSTLAFVAGRWGAVVVVGAIIGGATLALRFAVIRWILGLGVYAAPLAWLELLGVVPAAMAVGAVAIWVRTVFRHNVSAYLVSAVLVAGFLTATAKYHLPLLGLSRELFAPLTASYVPSIGRDLDVAAYGKALLNTTILSFFFLSLSCYHLHRREPQRPVARRSANRWSDVPTFLRWLGDLKLDRGAGAEVHLFFAATLVIGAVVGFRDLTHSREAAEREQRWARELRRELPVQAPATPGVWIRKYEGRIWMKNPGRIACDFRMEIMNTTATAIDDAVFELPFGLELSRSEDEGGAALERRSWGNIVLVHLGEPLAVGATTTIRLSYAGRPLALEIGGYDAFSKKYVVVRRPLEEKGISLGSNYVRFDSWLLPRSLSLEKRGRGITPFEMPKLFTADLLISTFSGLSFVSPNGSVEKSEGGPKEPAWRFNLDWPQGDFALLAGPYETVEHRSKTFPLKVFCFPEHREICEFVLGELAEAIERWGKVLGTPKGGACALIETPFDYKSDDRLPPGTLAFERVARVARYRPLYEKRDRWGRKEMYRFQRFFSEQLVGAVLRRSFHPARQIWALRPALCWYLVFTVRPSELGPLGRKSSRIFGRRRTDYRSVLLDPARSALFAKPLVERMAGPRFSPFDAICIWRMLHYLLEDEKFAAFVSTLLTDYSERIVGVAQIEATAERFYGAPLDWFFSHWFFGGGLPRYVIADARASMVENERTRDIEYDVTITVANRGRGKMPVPVVLETEKDRIVRKVWLDSATTATLSLHVPDRPEMVYVDPAGWITQQAPPEGSGGPVKRKVRIFE